MRKILVATGLYPPDIGGPATYTKMLEAELPGKGYEPIVVPFGEVRPLPKGIRHVAYLLKLLRATKDCEIVYSLDSMSVGIPALLVSRLRRTPFMVRLGGDYAWEQGRIRYGLTMTLDEYTADRSGRPLMVRILAGLQSFVVRRARVAIAPSEYLKSIIVTWGVREDRVKVVYSALFPLPVEGSRDTIRSQLSYSGTVLVTAARLTPWKGIGTVIEMVKRYKDDGKDVTLIIAGDGEARASLEAHARKLDVEDRVRFVGKLSKEALGAVIKGADAFIYNTQYEGLPHQLLEVMDLGIPIVTTNIPGNREVITDGKHGLLVSPNDIDALMRATDRVIESKELRDRLTQNARVRTKEFAQERVIEQLIDILDTI